MTKIVKIMGGLGNQLFQWTFAYALSKNTKDTVLLDTTQYLDKDIPQSQLCYAKRTYQLSEYKLDGVIKTASDEEMKPYLKTKKNKNKFPKFIRKIFNMPKYNVLPSTFEKEENIYDESLFKKEGDVHYEGYFQTERYFIDYRDEILNLIQLKSELDEKNQEILNKIKSCNAVSLHVRMGDFKSLNAVLSLDYYQKAIDYIVSKVDNPVFFIFSDEMDFVKENLIIEKPKYYVDINSAENCHFDLELIKNCKHNIIANSTFSWWGAWLNENKDKIIVAPKDKYDYAREIVPSHWIRL